MHNPKCGKKTRSGEPCKNGRLPGTTVCRMHGGKAPQVKAAAARNLVLADASRAVVGITGWSPVIDPLTALADIAGEVTAVKDHLRGLVNRIIEREQEFEQDAVRTAAARLTGESVSLRVPDDKGAEQMRAEFTAYMAMLNSTVATLATIAKLNIDERLARITEAQKTVIIDAMRRGFAAAGVTGPALDTGLSTVSRHLRSVK